MRLTQVVVTINAQNLTLMKMIMHDGEKKAEMWSELTSLPDNKQGLAGALALQGKAGIQGHNIPKEELKAINGLQILLEKLDEVYMPGMFDRQLGSFTDYYNCRRKPD